jgi:hypothetical protein
MADPAPALPTSPPFSRSLTAAMERVDPESTDDIGTALARQVVILQAAGRLLTVNYRAFYTTEEDGWARLVLFTEGLYQQLHAAATTTAVLLAQTASPPLKNVGSLSGLVRKLNADPSHPLALLLRRERRAVGLLTWLLEARNQTIQHRAERGYVNEQGMVLQDGFVLIRRSKTIDPTALRKARDLFRGVCNRYGEWNETPNDDREALTYLDLGSHELWSLAPADYDSCRRVVEDAAAYDLVASLPVLENADAALSALIEMAPPVSGRRSSCLCRPPDDRYAE